MIPTLYLLYYININKHTKGSRSFHELERQIHSRLEENQQHYTSDISSYSFPLSSRFAVSGIANGNLANPVAQTNESVTSDSVERIRQGLLTMQTIMSTMDSVHFPTDPLINDTATTAVDYLNCDELDLKSNDYSGDTNDVPVKCSSYTGGLKSVDRDRDRDRDINKQQEELHKNETSLNSYSKKQISTNDNENIEKNSKQMKQSPSRLPKRTAAWLAESNYTENLASKSVNNFEKTSKYSTICKSEIPADNGITADGVHDVKEPAAVFGNINGKEGRKEVTAPSSASHAVKKKEIKVRKFFVGQWIDVKDTVAQWLEASVLQVEEQEERFELYI
jgi:hypothetical protein